LKATPGLNYIGYVEGRDFFEGAADVVITDGLVGNTLLKAAEGMAKSLFKALAAEILEQQPELMLKFEPIVKAIYAKNDYHEHGGAPLLGINGGCIIAHGSSEARTIRAAIRNCRGFALSGINEEIVTRLASVAHVGGGAKESENGVQAVPQASSTMPSGARA
jgi:glycerol-3-phosphate acyltransferase PlsX